MNLERKYSALDLLRYKKFADKHPDLKPVELIKLYNKYYPQLTAKQMYDNIMKFLNDDFNE